MNCREFEQTILEIGAEHQTHAASCASCAARLASEQRLTSEFRALAADETTINAPDRVLTALRAARRERQTTHEQVWGNEFSTSQIRISGMLERVRRICVHLGLSVKGLGLNFTRTSADGQFRWRLAFAMLLLMSMLFAFRFLQTAGKRVEEIAHQSPPGLIDPSPESEKPAASHPRRGKPLRRTVARARRPVAPTNPRDAEGAIFPLTYVARSGPEAFTQTVRVEISRATLQSMGLPINPDRNDAMIRADLIIGEDGVARAVRVLK